MISIEAFVDIPARRIVAGVAEHHRQRRSLGRLHERDGHSGVRNVLGVRREDVLPIVQADALVHAEPGFSTPEHESSWPEARERAGNRAERLIPDKKTIFPEMDSP
jgi:hypothetical protein